MFRPNSALSAKLNKRKLKASKMRRPPVDTSGKGKIMGGPRMGKRKAPSVGGLVGKILPKSSAKNW